MIIDESKPVLKIEPRRRYTVREIADMFGVSRTMVWQILQIAERKLRKGLIEAGVEETRLRDWIGGN
jgi:DNA-directed RNA polymerase sigma subunit (sigma70/sigma32)